MFVEQPRLAVVVNDQVEMIDKLDEQDRVIEALRGEGVAEHHIQIALGRQEKTHETLTQIMRPDQLGFLSGEGVARVNARLHGFAYKSMQDFEELEAAKVLAQLDARGIVLTSTESGVPVGLNGTDIELAISENEQTLNASVFPGLNHVFCMVSAQTQHTLWCNHFARTGAALHDTLRQLESQVKGDAGVDQGLVRRFILSVLRHGCYQQMSDVEFCSTSPGSGMVLSKRFGESQFVTHLVGEVWVRVYTYLVTDLRATDAIKEEPVDRLFEILNSDVQFSDLAKRYSFRVSLIKRHRAPDEMGSITIRLLDSQRDGMDFELLGFDEQTQKDVSEIIDRSDGLFLVTGPTGSGKTTTLYSILTALVDPVRRWVKTIEYPIEYARGMWRQFAIDDVKREQHKSDQQEGQGADRLLKGLLRAAPDVILYGEIRSADIAASLVNAATTGHLCASTLHNNDAASALNRLNLMGLDMPALADVLRGVLALRLVRTVCAACAQDDSGVEVELALKDASYLGSQVRRPRRGVGCLECDGSGFRGRKLIYELLKVTPDVQDAIEQGVTARKIAAKFIHEERSMKASAMRLVASGHASYEEIKRLGLR
jgi:Tfp pilus assembly pilus retraction ATPase PilT